MAGWLFIGCCDGLCIDVVDAVVLVGASAFFDGHVVVDDMATLWWFGGVVYAVATGYLAALAKTTSYIG